MGACREGFNLLNEYGRQHFVSHIRGGRWRYAMSFAFLDTFGHPMCWLFWHRPYHANEECRSEPPEYACRRCHRWLRPAARGGGR